MAAKRNRSSGPARPAGRGPERGAAGTAVLEALRAALHREIAEVLDALDGPHPTSEATVHGARRAIKRARAQLRLLRPALGDARYRRANTRLRDAARPLSGLRDAQMLAESLAVLRARPEGRSLRLGGLQRSVAARRRADAAALARGTQGLAPIRYSLRAVLRTSAKWSFARGADAGVVDAIAGIYRRGRRALATARERPEADPLHEWRKQVKYLSDAVRALEPFGSRRLHRLGRRTRRLAEFLGEQHDHAVLLEQLGQPGGTPRADARRLARTLRHEDERSLAEAFELGEEVFDDRPRAFARRMAGLLDLRAGRVAR